MDGKEEQKELVWLPKKLADKVKDVQDKGALEKEIIAYVDKSRKELKNQVECFDEDVLIFRAHLAKAKAAFKNAYEAHHMETYELWEDFEKKTVQVKQFVATAVGILEPLKRELNEVNELMRQINKWELHDLLKALEAIAKTDRSSRKMLKFLFANYKSE